MGYAFPSHAWSTHPFLFWEECLAQIVYVVKEGSVDEQDLRLLRVCKLTIASLFA